MEIKNTMKNPNELNLVKLHKEVLDSILKTTKREEERDGSIWKILISDSFCENMISTILKVGNLRELNITLHLHLSQKGEKKEKKLHGAKVYYLVQPTQENFELIKKDFSEDLYDQVYLNFSSFASETLLQDLAVHIGNLNAVYKIKRVVQHTTDFVTIAKDLFTLNIPNSYSLTHNQESENLISQEAMGLFSLLRTTKQIPIILYKTNEKNSQKVAIELANLFYKYFLNSRDYEEEQSDFISQNKSNPILILSERDSDLGSQLLHPWHYAALAHDIFKIENNKIKIQDNSQGSSSSLLEGKTFDLDCSIDDSYWIQHMNEPFPDVATDINDKLSKWEQESQQLLSKKLDASQVVAGNIKEMQDKKRIIEIYLSISTGIMNEIKVRTLDKYFEVEASIIKEKALKLQEKKDLYSIFEQSNQQEQNTSLKNDLDKLRVFLIYLIFATEIDVVEFQKLQTVANIQNKKYQQILDKFIKIRVPNYQAISTAAATNIIEEEIGDKIGDKIGGILGKIASSVKQQGIGLLNNLKSQLAGVEQEFKITSNVKSLIETKCQSFEKLGYQLLDIMQKENPSSLPLNFSDIIVFSVDGANFNEHQNLQMVCKKLGKSLIYGGSEILNAESFIEQLSQI